MNLAQVTTSRSNTYVTQNSIKRKQNTTKEYPNSKSFYIGKQITFVKMITLLLIPKADLTEKNDKTSRGFYLYCTYKYRSFSQDTFTHRTMAALGDCFYHHAIALAITPKYRLHSPKGTFLSLNAIIFLTRVASAVSNAQYHGAQTYGLVRNYPSLLTTSKVLRRNKSCG